MVVDKNGPNGASSTAEIQVERSRVCAARSKAQNPRLARLLRRGHPSFLAAAIVSFLDRLGMFTKEGMKEFF